MVSKIIKNLLFLFLWCANIFSNDELAIKNIDIQNFETEVLQTALPLFFKISVLWCSSCIILQQIFEEMVLEFDGKAIFANANVDTFKNQDLLQKIFHDYQIIIGGFPVILVFYQGKYLKLLYVRGQDKESLKKTFYTVLENIEKGLL